MTPVGSLVYDQIVVIDKNFRKEKDNLEIFCDLNVAEQFEVN